MPSTRTALLVGAVALALVAVGAFTAIPLSGEPPTDQPPVADEHDEPAGEGITVAVVDSGIDDSHAALEGRVVDRIDLTDGGGSGGGGDGETGIDEHGHGTHIAGIVAGSGARDGDPGVAPGADLVDVRVLSEEGEGDAERIAEGIEYAVEEAGADVVVLSLNVEGIDAGPIDESVASATDRGTLVVASAGNAGADRSITDPGTTPELLTVGATADDGTVLEHSSRGPTDDGHLKPELVAPGERIPGPAAGTDDEYTTRTGTSVAAPQVAGAAALLLADDPSLTPDELEARLVSTASPVADADPYAAGAGELDLEAALAADVIVRDGVLDYGLLEDDEPVTKRVTLENVDDRPHEVTLGTSLENLDADAQLPELDPGDGEDGDLGLPEDLIADLEDIQGDETGAVTADGGTTITPEDPDGDPTEGDGEWTAGDDGPTVDDLLSLSRTEMTLEPGETATVELTVDGGAASGIHAGALEYTVSSADRSVPIGFVRGGTVTVEKVPLSDGDRVDGDPLFFFTEDGTHAGIQDFEDGETSFVAGAGTYVLWSKGVDRETGSIVFLSERLEVDGEEHVVLEEADTIPVGVDASPIVEEYGPLENVTVAASMSTAVGGETNQLSRTLLEADNRTVRVSEDPANAIATTYLLTPEGTDELAAEDVFQLHYEAASSHWTSPAEIHPDDLETTTYRIHRTTQDRSLEAQDRTTTTFQWNDPARYWFDLGDRGTQHVHRTERGASHDRDLRGDGLRATVSDRTREEGPIDVLAHPFVAMVDLDLDLEVEGGVVTVGGEPLADGAGTTISVDGTHALSVAVDGEVRETVTGSDPELTARDVPFDPDAPLTVTLEGSNPDGLLSRNTTTAVRLAEPGVGPQGDDRRTPLVRDVAVPDADETNAVDPGEVTVTYAVDDARSVRDRTVWYATDSSDAGDATAGDDGDDGDVRPPWKLEEPAEAGWTEASTGYADGRLTATLEVPESAETVSLAAEFDADDRVRTATTDAFFVGAAPNTSTRTISGTITTHDGTPAHNDTVLAAPVEGDGDPTIARTDNGAFDLEVPKDEEYDLVYRAGEPWTLNRSPADGRPAFAGLERVTADEDRTLEQTLPEASQFDLEVIDDRGEAVPNATVSFGHHAANVSVGASGETDDDGRLRIDGDGEAETGIVLGGTLSYTVEPPEGGPYENETVSGSVYVEEPTLETVELPTRPPGASLESNRDWMLEGTAVTLDAGGSDVPAGATEYRWDYTGDGDVDEVTHDARLRTELEAGTTEVTVTVVDAVGRTDEASTTVRVDPLE